MKSPNKSEAESRMEHISSILQRALDQLLKDWEQQRKQNEFETEDQTSPAGVGEV